MKVSQFLTNWLDRNSFRLAFGIPGGAIATFYDEMVHLDQLETVLTQHECAAAYMAMGYNVASRGSSWALAFATSGPGATNLLTGVAVAHFEQIPLLVVVGDVASTCRGQGAVQDSSPGGIDLVSMAKKISVFTSTVSSVSTVEHTFDEAWSVALEKRGPAFLLLPADVAKAQWLSIVDEPQVELSQVNL